MLENLVFLKIKDLEPTYFLEESIEIDFVTKESIIEAKYDREIEKKQKDLLEKMNIKGKKKIIANGVDFFME